MLAMRLAAFFARFIRPNHMSTQCIYNCSRKVSHITF